MRVFVLCLGVAIIMTSATFAAPVTGFLNRSLESEGTAYPYVLYVPRDYTPDTAWPLVVFLHGAGERGDDGLIQSEVGIGASIRRHAHWYPGLVLMPQCPKGQVFEGMLGVLDSMLIDTVKDYSIDTQRIYLTGLSMGGYGTWSWGAERADWFAALMPVCGGGEPENLNRILDVKNDVTLLSFDERIQRLANKPVWVFHGAKDGVVPPERSRKMVKALKEAGGNPKYTEFPEAFHNAWDPTYAMKEAIDWLFAQRNPVTPEVNADE